MNAVGVGRKGVKGLRGWRIVALEPQSAQLSDPHIPCRSIGLRFLPASGATGTTTLHVVGRHGLTWLVW